MADAEYNMPDGTVVVAPDGASKEQVKAVWELGRLQEARENTAKQIQELKGKIASGQSYRPGTMIDVNPDTIAMSRQRKELLGNLNQFDEAIRQRKSAVAKMKADTGGALDKAGYVAKQAGSAIMRGLAALPAMAAQAGISTDPGRYGKTPPKPLQDVGNLGLAPQTTPEKYAYGALEAASGAVMGPGIVAAPARTLTVGAASGLGAEAGGQVTDDNPLGRLIGGLAGGIGASAPSMVKTTRQDLVNETLRDVSEEQLRKAQAEMEAVRQSGAGEINLSQAMETPSNIDSTVAALANSRFGRETQKQLQAQPEQASFAAEAAVSELPGVQRSPQMAANNMQAAASDAIAQEYKVAGQKWQELAPEGSVIPENAVKALDSKLRKLAEKYPNTTGADLINDARKALVNPKKGEVAAAPVILDASGNPMKEPQVSSKYLTDALQLKGALEDSISTFGSRKLNTSSLDAKNTRRAQEVREAFREVIAEYAPKLREADAAYSSHLTNVIAPLKQSEIGRIAGRQGYSEEMEASLAKVTALFDKGTVPGARNSEILSAQKALAKTDDGNRVFQDAFKTWARGKLSKAVETETNRFPANAAERLAKVFGNPEYPSTASQGMKDSLVALARSQNLPDDSLVKGFENVQRFLSAAARRPASVGDSRFDVKAAAQGTSQEVLRTNENAILAGLRVRFREMKERDAYTFMDKLITTPEGVETLIKMSKQKPMSEGAANTLATFIGTAVSTDTETTE
jgi:hypothetical protein